MIRRTPLVARLALAATLLAPASAAAQGSPRATIDEHATWLAYFGVHPVSERWRLHLEMQLRQTEGVAQPAQRLYRTALLRTLGPAARAGAGYAYVRTYPPEEFVADPIPFGEHRAWEQLDLRLVTGPVQWDNRYRLEQRWVERLGAGGADPARRVGWTYTNRARYLLRATVAAGGGPPQRGRAYLTAYDELFVSFGRNVRGNVFDQNRLFGGAGYRWTPTLRSEAGYQLQYVLRANGTDAERNHTLLVALFSEVPLFR